MPLDYAGIRVQNLRRSLSFYTRLLGLRELRRGKMPQGGVWVLLQDPVSHQHLELNWYPKGSRHAVPYSVGEGLDHLGFRVHDIDGSIRRLKRAGVPTAMEPLREKRKIWVAYFLDPDGIWIELIRHPEV